MNITPTNDLLVIRRIIDEEPKTASGILLPPVEENANTPYSGVVLAVGPGRPAKLSGAGKEVVAALQALMDAYHAMPNINWGARGFGLDLWQRAADALENHSDGRVPMQVKVGDTVIFSKHLYQEFRVDGEDVMVTQEASIMSVVDNA